MNRSEILTATESYVKEILSGAEAGHNWWHIHRVRNLAVLIADQENGDIFIVELAALLHDIADSKFNGGDEEIGPSVATTFLNEVGADEQTTQQVVAIIANMSFHNTFEQQQHDSLELAIVQDADRLDAIGAIGIARTFHYGGYKNREIYNPEIMPQIYTDKEMYKSNTAPTINHFYEKLLLLKDLMHTETARKLAHERHAFMEQFLSQFYEEWDGER